MSRFELIETINRNREKLDNPVYENIFARLNEECGSLRRRVRDIDRKSRYLKQAAR